jgi:RNA polymerase sigma-70 factor, ECF subfamily
LERNEGRYTVRERDHGLHLALRGDREALGCLLAFYMPRLYRVALRVVGTPEDAEDALQDGLVQVVQHLREFEGRSQFSTWLTRIVINAALMRLRHSRRDVITSMDQNLDRDELPLAESIADPRPNPEEAYARKEQRQILERKLRSLPAAHRSALWLHDVRGMGTREAAEALEVPVGSLKSNLHRGRLRLRAEVGAARDTRWSQKPDVTKRLDAHLNLEIAKRGKTFRTARRNAPATGHRVNLELMEEVGKSAA